MSNEVLTEPHYLEFDSNFFSLKIGKIDFTTSQYDLNVVHQSASTQGYDCVYILVNETNSVAIKDIDATSARYIDGRLTLGRRLEKMNSDTSSFDPHLDNHISELKEIASQSHTDTRFYADEKFERLKCDELYSLWIEKSCNGMADKVFVPTINESAAGYITASKKGDVGNIGLLAVSEKFRGQGLGKQLIQSALNWFQQEECSSADVVTQYRNVAAQSLYQSMGFRTIQAERWYHWWISEERK